VIEIKSYKYPVFCDYGAHGYAKHSIGHTDTATELRLNICTQCLIGIVTQGLAILTDEEKSEILREYLPKSEEELQQEETQQEELQQEVNTETSQEPESVEDNASIETILKGEGEAQKLDKEVENKRTPQEIRDDLLSKARELGIEGKIVTFTNKMLENEIEKKEKSKTGGK
jgi:hypothetical protein